MRVGESLERGFDSLEKWQSTSCMGIHTLDPLWQVSLEEEEEEEEEEVHGATVKLNALVRGCYVSHLGRVLAKNCELCSSGSDYVFTSHDIEKCTAQLEMSALRACMVSSLYQKAMTQMTADIKRNTKEMKLYEKLKEFIQRECTCSNKENKETQTDSIDETLPDILNIKTEPDIESDVQESQVPVHAPNPVVFPETPNPEPVNYESQAMPIPVYVSGMTVTPNNFNIIPTVDTQDHENFFNSDTSHLWFGSSTSHLFGSKKVVGDKAGNSPKNGLYSLKNGIETSAVLLKQQEKLNNSVSVPQKISECVRSLRSEDKSAVEKLSNMRSRRVDSSCGRVVKRLRLNGDNNKVNPITSDAKIIRNFACIGGEVPETTEKERSILGIRRLESSERIICEDSVGKESGAKKWLKLPVPCENDSSESNDSGTQHLLRILESEGEEGGDSDVTADVQDVIHSSRSDQRSKSIEHQSRGKKFLLSGFDLGRGTVPDNSEPNIWTMQKFIQQRLLHDKIARTCCYPEKKLEVLSGFNELFGYDSDEDEVWCSEQQITKYRRRIASWVVERLLPYYREKRVVSRLIFKAVAREITNKLISVNHLPSEDDVEKAVLLFFSYHGVITSESDIWDGWGKTLK